MRRLRGTILACLAAAAVRLSAFGHETDQFTLPPGREFAELGPYFNHWVYQTIFRGVTKVNHRIEQCVADRCSPSSLANLQSQEEIVRAVNSEFPNAYDEIEGLERLATSTEMQNRYPGQVIGYREMFTNIYEHVHFPLDPRQLFRLWHASTFKIYGTYIGGDKFGHFTDMGMHYYIAYRDAIKKGETEQAAMAAAVSWGTEGFIFSERGMLGYLSAGAYSNGDLMANYLGLLFYRNLTEPVMLKGRLQPPMLVRQGDLWKFAPHVRSDSDFFANFICDQLNEALNPSLFESDMRSEVRSAVKKRTEAILARYCDQHGNRRPKTYFDQRVAEFTTYCGADYGHDGSPDELISIGNTCFEVFPADARPTLRNNCGDTPLHVAAMQSDPTAVRSLLDRGADPNSPVRSKESYSSEWGNTPLHYAARNGNGQIARMLLAAGADVNARSDRGQTPLHRSLGDPDLTAMLLQKGANVNAQDNAGQTPLHWAAMDGQTDTIQLMLDNGADVNARDNQGRTPLHLAAGNGRADAAIALIHRSADINAGDQLGLQPLHWAAQCGSVETIDVLISSGAGINGKDEFGWTALHAAASNGHAPALDHLLSARADPTARDCHGATPLHLAARHGWDEASSHLIASGADVNASNHLGNTPLHEASFAGDYQIASDLIKHGANPAVRDRRGRMPVDIAMSKGYSEVVAVLRNSGQMAAVASP